MDFDILSDWGVREELYRDNYFIDKRPMLWEYDIQLRCINSLFYYWGYTVSVLYVSLYPLSCDINIGRTIICCFFPKDT